MMSPSRESIASSARGRRGERLAQKFLEGKGFTFIERNFKTPRWGEIDLVMRDGGTTVFVEVKTRSSSSAQLFGGPLGSINYHKMKALKRAGQFYLSSKGYDREAVRIDAVSVVLNEQGDARIEHFANIP
ncbi:MAG: YraN family protein [Patescibacteria group bacterium]|nr:MAG: YraN family protein [Patescibacteria group bacterium]